MSIDVESSNTAASNERLLKWLSGLDGAAIAFSGGVDSTFLLACAKEALGDRAVAFTVRSSFFPQWEQSDAEAYAQKLGARFVELDADVLNNPDVARNDRLRCYHCKLAVFGMIKQSAAEMGLHNLCDGSNADDIGDYRPGEQAARELGVLSPLKELGYTKREIRECSAAMGLETATKPAYACLATRIPTGEPVSEQRLRRIEGAEDYLHGLGFWGVRVRDHGSRQEDNSLARIELPPQDMAAFMALDWGAVVGELRRLGYRYVTLDMAGYEKGSMNARE